MTGGGRGIGRTVALTLADHGAHLAICGRTAATLQKTADDISAKGVTCWPIVADVTDLSQIEHFVAETARAAGRIDILVNNAVSSKSAPFDEQSDDDWRHHIDVKLVAYIRMVRAVLPHMQARKWGRIVNTGGMTARIAAPLRVTNGINNAGVANLTSQLAGQLGPDGITINCVHPGATMTDRQQMNLERRARDAGIPVDEMRSRAIAEIPLGRLIEPADVANAVLFFCSPLADMITGQAIAVDGGQVNAINY
ncbi:MAG: SDR family oxidoreductase [Alphaproteobacteria bacterium]